MDAKGDLLARQLEGLIVHLGFGPIQLVSSIDDVVGKIPQQPHSPLAAPENVDQEEEHITTSHEEHHTNPARRCNKEVQTSNPEIHPEVYSSGSSTSGIIHESNSKAEAGAESFRQTSYCGTYGATNLPAVMDDDVNSRVCIQIVQGQKQPLIFHKKERTNIEAQICAGIFGKEKLTLEIMKGPQWVRKMISLAYRGIRSAGFFHRQATKKLYTVYQLPNLLRDKAALPRKCKQELKDYVKKNESADLDNRETLTRIQRELEANKGMYFGRDKVKVVIQMKKNDEEKHKSDVDKAYDALHQSQKNIEATVTREGSNFVDWECTVAERFIGTGRTKKEARRDAVTADPEF